MYKNCLINMCYILYRIQDKTISHEKKNLLIELQFYTNLFQIKY